MALTHKQALAIRERDTLVAEMSALQAQMQQVRKQNGLLRAENDYLQNLIAQAKALGWRIETPQVRPEELIEHVRAQALKQAEEKKRRKAKPEKPDDAEADIAYDTTWQVTDGDDTERTSEGVVDTL